MIDAALEHPIEDSTMNNDNSAPRLGCRCPVCHWARRRAERDAELDENYKRYLAGLLVSRNEKG